MILLRLFWEFFKTGLFAVGGGMATVPFLQDISAKTGWYTSGQLADMIAVSESTPGPLGVNMATYVGYTVGSQQLGGVGMGVVGAIVSTLGLIFPSIVVILIIGYFLKRFRDSKIGKASLSWKAAVLALAVFAGTNLVPKLKKIHPIWFIFFSAVAGILLHMG